MSQQKNTQSLTTVMFLSSMMLLSTGTSYTMVFPISPFVVRHFHMGKEEDTGFYSGILCVMVPLAQMVSSWIIGYLSDVYVFNFVSQKLDSFGRRKFILLAMLVNAIGNSLFGLAQNYTQAVLIRLVQGMPDALIPLSKAYIFENTDDSTQSSAFIVIVVSWGLSILIANTIVAFLSDPVAKFGIHSTFLKHNPFFLSCLAIGIVNLIALVICAFLLRDKDRESEEYEMLKQTDELLLEDKEKEKQSKVRIHLVRFFQSCKHVITSPIIIVLIFLYAALAVNFSYVNNSMSNICSAFDQVFPLWTSYSKRLRGLEWSTSPISVIYGLAGICSIGSIWLYPFLVSKLGITRCFSLSFLIASLFLLLFSFNYELYVTTKSFPLTVISVSIGMIIKQYTFDVLYTAQDVLLNNATPEPLIGFVNGLCNSIGAISNILGPLGSASIMSGTAHWISKHHPAFPVEKIIFFVMGLFMFVSAILACFLPERLNKRVVHHRENHSENENSNNTLQESVLDEASKTST